MFSIVYRITRAGRDPLFHPVLVSRICKGAGVRSAPGKEDFEREVPSEIGHLASRYLMLSVYMNSGALYRRHFSFFPFQESHAAAFCKPSWRTNADVTLLCGVPPMVGVTSGGGAERRKPIVASTRPNHLRFCGQAIHVPSSFSRYSLTAHLDRDEPRYRLLPPL